MLYGTVLLNIRNNCYWGESRRSEFIPIPISSLIAKKAMIYLLIDCYLTHKKVQSFLNLIWQDWNGMSLQCQSFRSMKSIHHLLNTKCLAVA